MFQKRCLISRGRYNLALPVKNLEFISILRGVPHDLEAYIVGGAVRDLLIGKEPVDVDIVVYGDAEGFARILFKKIDGAIFLLDKKRRIFRITSREKTPPYYFDVSPIRGEDIVADLSFRDFTIDALAMPFSDINSVIDPFNGREDLRKRCIRVISRESFKNDPLRLLRAFRLASTLGFDIDPETLNTIGEMASTLRVATRERIRDEFFRLLSPPSSAESLWQMDRVGLLKEILTGLDGPSIEKGLSVVSRLEALYKKIPDLFSPHHSAIESYFIDGIEEGITRRSLWKWITLYSVNDIAPALITEASEGLRLSNRAYRLAFLGVKHIEPDILKMEIIDRKFLYHFFNETGDDGIGIILSQLASAGDDYDRAIRNAKDAISWYLQEYKAMKSSPLITGDEIMELFHIPPGPYLGRLLGIVEENRAVGLLTTKKDVLSFLIKLVTNV